MGAAPLNGGTDIASAPELPIGQEVSGGGTSDAEYTEFWRILLRAADHVRLDYASTNGTQVIIGVLPPSVTDYNYTGNLDAMALPFVNGGADRGTTTKDEGLFVAPRSGDYTIALQVPGPNDVLAYTLTGYVRHYTHTTITAPPLVRKRAAVVYRGTVAGASSGKIELQSRSLTHSVWKTFALATIDANGSFRYRTRVAGTGTYRIRAVYPGDSSHLPSMAIVSFKVV